MDEPEVSEPNVQIAKRIRAVAEMLEVAASEYEHSSDSQVREQTQRLWAAALQEISALLRSAR